MGGRQGGEGNCSCSQFPMRVDPAVWDRGRRGWKKEATFLFLNERDTSVLMRERMATNYFSPVPAVRSPGSNSS